MKNKIKQIGIPFILMLILNLGIYYLIPNENFASGISIYYGILFVSALLFGPYGAFGSVAGNFLCDILRGYNIQLAITSEIISFLVAYLAYKSWYGTFKRRNEVTRPKLNNTYNIVLFFGIIVLTGLLLALLNSNLAYIMYPETAPKHDVIILRYFLNYVNSSFIFGIIGIWFFEKIDFIFIPEIASKKFNKKLYEILGLSIIFSLILSFVLNIYFISTELIIVETVIITLLIFVYSRKPINSIIMPKYGRTIPEEITDIFLLTTLIIMILSFIISYDMILISTIEQFLPLEKNEIALSMLTLTDIIVLIFFIPSVTVINYIENKIIAPILSFSEIERFIKENEKIETEGLVNIYSKYIYEQNEIGTLARSYTDLINHNNNYIENLREIEGEKERINAELEIATKIQASTLPTESIETNDFIVTGYSKPAKEVGGDFFDYYQLDDDNLAIVIGDASGKGIPAAILSMITQVIIKQILIHEQDPSEILYSLNNQLSENNPESMFLTLWLGIYNRQTKKLTFSNAGHNPPLIKENNEFKYLNVDSGIVLGIMEDFNYLREEKTLTDEFILYTDGITDANNSDNEMYGEDRLLKFLNEFESDDDPIIPLLNDISSFTKDEKQYDDMTLLYLKIK